MANQEIHNYLDEQTTPNESDFLDIDADLGSGNWLSKKLSLFNIRKWLFKLVSQDVIEYTGSGVFGGLFNNHNVAIFNCNGNTTITTPSTPPYSDSATYLMHIYNTTGETINLDNTFITEPNNPPITTTIGGYAQLWVTYHKKADNTEIFTANTINFS
jgi:hypothetical protein